MAEIYHISEELASQTEASTLFTLLTDFEDAQPYPDSVVPNIPQDAKAQLGTIDKLAQVIVPKLVDKLNEANWKIRRLEYLLVKHNGAIEMMQKHMAQLAASQAEPAKKTRTRKKKTPPELVVDMTEIADYDPDTDTWGPITLGGVSITGALIDTVEHLSGAATEMYSDELVQFIHNMEPHIRKAIAERFPN